MELLSCNGIVTQNDVATNLESEKNLYLQINIDGLPLFKSSNYQLWPILGIIRESVKKEPIVIAMYGGNKKPNNLEEFLGEFISELNNLESNGFLCEGCAYKINLHSFVCDAPARALFSAYFSDCEWWPY
ncbi:MAG: hypothetical protein WAX04_02275 [Oscillospiraceae bacterium]